MNISIGQEIYNEVLNKTGIVKEVGRYYITVKSNNGSTEQWCKQECEVVEYECC